jgi:hypothetical protein
MDQLISLIFLASAVLTPLVFILEVVLSTTWNRHYFTHGIPLLAWSMPSPAAPPARPIDEAMNDPARSSGFAQALVFKRLDLLTYAFRERFQVRPLAYSPVMRGLLVLRPANARVEVRGYLNWTAIAFALAFGSSALLPQPVAPIWFGAAILAVAATIAVVQIVRFIGVAREAAHLWETLSASIESAA